MRHHLSPLDPSAAAQHSEGTNWYSVWPYQQTVLLTDGKEMWGDGFYPQVSRYTKVMYPNGSTYISAFYPPAGSCWSAAYSSNSLYWPFCSTTGFSFSGSAYPPGQIEGHFYVYASGATGTFISSYTHSLN